MKRKLFEKAERALDFSVGILNNLPNITLYGTSCVEIDNFKGLLDFSGASVRVNTTDSVVCICGYGLQIAVMTDEAIEIKGKIQSVSFE